MYTTYLAQAGYDASAVTYTLYTSQRLDSPVTVMNGHQFLFFASLTQSQLKESVLTIRSCFFLRHSERTETPFSVMTLGDIMQMYVYLKPLQRFSCCNDLLCCSDLARLSRPSSVTPQLPRCNTFKLWLTLMACANFSVTSPHGASTQDSSSKELL